MCTLLRSNIHSTPWLNAFYPDNIYVWQQNGAFAHTSKKVKKFCSTNMASFWSKDFWLLSSYDLKPMDYFCRCAIDSKTSHTSHGNSDSLKTAIARNEMILPKGISGGPAPLSETVSGHASWQTKANQMKMFKMPTPCVHINFKPKFLKIHKLY